MIAKSRIRFPAIATAAATCVALVTFAAFQLGSEPQGIAIGIAPDRMIPNADVEVFPKGPTEPAPITAVEQRARTEIGTLPLPMSDAERAEHRDELAASRARIAALRQQYKFAPVSAKTAAAVHSDAKPALSK